MKSISIILEDPGAFDRQIAEYVRAYLVELLRHAPPERSPRQWLTDELEIPRTRVDRLVDALDLHREAPLRQTWQRGPWTRHPRPDSPDCAESAGGAAEGVGVGECEKPVSGHSGASGAMETLSAPEETLSAPEETLSAPEETRLPTRWWSGRVECAACGHRWTTALEIAQDAPGPVIPIPCPECREVRGVAQAGG